MILPVVMLVKILPQIGMLVMMFPYERIPVGMFHPLVWRTFPAVLVGVGGVPPMLLAVIRRRTGG